VTCIGNWPCPALNVRILLPELYALQHSNFFKFHVQTSSVARALFLCLLPVWNSLPHSLRFCESLATFRKDLKTLFFTRHSLMPHSGPPQRLRFNSYFWHFINSFAYFIIYYDHMLLLRAYLNVPMLLCSIEKRKEKFMDSLLTMPDCKLVLEVSASCVCSPTRWCF